MDIKPEQRPSEEERLQLIHEAALNAFVKDGYAGASMASIARAVGGSKTTLYSRYPSKKTLFFDVLRLELDRFFASICRFSAADQNIEKALHNHCLDFAKAAQDERSKNLYRLVMSECLRLPEIQMDYSVRVDRHIAMLSAAIEATMSNNALGPMDWHSVARLLFDLDMNFLYQQLQDRGMTQDPSAAQAEHAKYVTGMLLPALTSENENRR